MNQKNFIFVFVLVILFCFFFKLLKETRNILHSFEEKKYAPPPELKMGKKPRLEIRKLRTKKFKYIGTIRLETVVSEGMCGEVFLFFNFFLSV